MDTNKVILLSALDFALQIGRKYDEIFHKNYNLENLLEHIEEQYDCYNNAIAFLSRNHSLDHLLLLKKGRYFFLRRFFIFYRKSGAFQKDFL